MGSDAKVSLQRSVLQYGDDSSVSVRLVEMLLVVFVVAIGFP